MRILLVTTTELLPFTLSKVLNPTLEYCAIVVDEPDIAKQIFKNYPQITDLIHPLYELKECIENYCYDALIWNFNFNATWTMTTNEFKRYNLPKNKLVSFNNLNSLFNFQPKRCLQYYKFHSSEFDMFGTGISYSELGIIPELFSPRHNLFNFARASQDLYYDYKIAQFVFNQTSTGGGNSSIA